jgi:hypothetical protein
LIGDPETDESQRLLAGTVLFHSPDRDDVDRKLLELRKIQNPAFSNAQTASG